MSKKNTLKIKRRFSEEDKKFMYALTFLTPIMWSIGIIIVFKTLNLSGSIFFVPFLFVISFAVLFYFIRDLIWHRKIMQVYWLLLLLVPHIISAYYLLHITTEGNNETMKLVILCFMGLFYISFVWDFFVSIKWAKKISKVYQKKLIKIFSNTVANQDNTIIVDGENFFKHDIQRGSKFISFPVIGIFMLPFSLLGKGAAYILAIGLSQYYSAHEFILAALLFPGTLFLLTGSVASFIAIMGLKYPNKEKQN